MCHARNLQDGYEFIFIRNSCAFVSTITDTLDSSMDIGNLPQKNLRSSLQARHSE